MRYTRSQRIVLKKYQTYNENLPFLIREIILNRSKCLPLQINILDENVINSKSVADSFIQSCYTLMTTDINRTNTYKSWIEGASNHLSYLTWFEVGPGADACLSKFVLDKYTNSKYIGIETNKFAYESAKKKLKNYSNAKLIKAYVDTNFVANKALGVPKSVDYILHEIFGTIASSEGVGMVLHKLKQLYPSSISIPSYAQTFIVPLNLTCSDIINDPTLIITPILIRCKIPFDKTEMTSTHATLEYLDFDDVILQQTHITKCIISKNGFISALGIYINIGFNNVITTSNQDKSNASTNWSNIGLMLPNKVHVKYNQAIVIKSTIDISTTIPSYYIELIVNKDIYTFQINPNDLYGTYQELHTIHD